MNAFKDWSYIIHALGTGQQSIVLRRGGIHETDPMITVDSDMFLLFPTLFHQEGDKIKVAQSNEFDESLYHPDQFHVHVAYAAKVMNYVKVVDETQLAGLDQMHIWSDEVVKERFHRWNKNEVYCLLLRVYELQKPLTIELTPDLGGCKSWVDVDVQEVDVKQPVLSDMAFDEVKNQLTKVLNT